MNQFMVYEKNSRSVLSNYTPSEIVTNYNTPEQFYASLSLDQKKAIAGMVNKENTLHNSL